MQKPDFIFETSWEVCNKVGGIYAVLSTRAKEMMEYANGNILFVGPELWHNEESPYFNYTNELPLFTSYMANNYNLKIRVGRWLVPGRPLAVLVDFSPLYENKNAIYGQMWELYKVDSLHAYGDYDEASMFGYAAGLVISGYTHFFELENQNIAAHFNEWMTAFGLFYIDHNEPSIATLFTTHATTIGRSIAGNGKPLYDYMSGYNGDQMAQELNVESKHSVEKRAAHLADCFTTVSLITDDECAQLLERRSDVVTPNGFEMDFVPKASQLKSLAQSSRKKLIAVAERILGYTLPSDVMLCATSGRYEYKNKGIDLFINALNHLNHNHTGAPILAFILVPGWHNGAQDLNNPSNHYTTHHLVEPWNDPISQALSFYGLNNSNSDRVKVIFVPAYLHGNDGIFDIPYYDILPGFDFTVFPSYYEPWGYTPLESIAFGVPTITTNLSGFGRWINPEGQELQKGVGVVLRTDNNFDSVSNAITQQIEEYIRQGNTQKTTFKAAQTAAKKYAQKAQWKHFFKHYKEAYNIALTRRKTKHSK